MNPFVLPIQSATSYAVERVVGSSPVVVIGGVGKSKLRVSPSSLIINVQPSYIDVQPPSPMLVTDGIAAAAVRDVQRSYILMHPPSPMVVKAGISAAEIRDVQIEYIPTQPPVLILVTAGIAAAEVRDVQPMYIK